MPSAVGYSFRQYFNYNEGLRDRELVRDGNDPDGGHFQGIRNFFTMCALLVRRTIQPCLDFIAILFFANRGCSKKDMKGACLIRQFLVTRPSSQSQKRWTYAE